MALRTLPVDRQHPDRVAILYGPVVLAQDEACCRRPFALQPGARLESAPDVRFSAAAFQPRRYRARAAPPLAAAAVSLPRLLAVLGVFRSDRAAALLSEMRWRRSKSRNGGKPASNRRIWSGQSRRSPITLRRLSINIPHILRSGCFRGAPDRPSLLADAETTTHPQLLHHHSGHDRPRTGGQLTPRRRGDKLVPRRRARP